VVIAQGVSAEVLMEAFVNAHVKIMVNIQNAWTFLMMDAIQKTGVLIAQDSAPVVPAQILEECKHHLCRVKAGIVCDYYCTAVYLHRASMTPVTSVSCRVSLSLDLMT